MPEALTLCYVLNMTEVIAKTHHHHQKPMVMLYPFSRNK
jgi:hypothetical protein